MGTLAAWAAVCGVVACATLSRPVRGVCLALVLWACAPAVSVVGFTGQQSGPAALHPASVLLIVLALASLTFRPTAMADAVTRRLAVFTVVAMFTTVAMATSVLAETSQGARLLLDQILAPWLAFWLITAQGPRDRSAVTWLRSTVLLVAVAQALLALAQRALGQVIVYQKYYEQLYWFKPEKAERWMGTTDSPLALALVLAVAASLGTGIRSTAARLTVLAVLTAGIVATQSRSALVAIGVILVHTVLASRSTLFSRVVSAIAIVVGSWWALSSGFVEGVLSRFSDDTGSAEARLRAWQVFQDEAPSVLFAGKGMLASYDLADDVGLGTSFESSALMYAVDVGLIITVAYFVVQFAIPLVGSAHPAVAGARLGALIGLTLAQTFSALGSSSAVGLYIWTVLALATLRDPLRTPSPDHVYDGDVGCGGRATARPPAARR